MRTTMRPHSPLTRFLALAMATCAWPAAAQERERSAVPEKYRWNLADLYPTDTAWRAAKGELAGETAALDAYKGRLATSGPTLADALEKMSALGEKLGRLYSYAFLRSDEDTRDATHQGMKQEMADLAAKVAAAESFIAPEILRIPKAKLDAFVAAEPRLGVYRLYLDDIARRAPHMLDDGEEKLLAGLGPLAGTPAETYGIIADADLPYPTVTLSDGRSVKVDQAAYSGLRTLPNRADREKVMSAFFGALGAFNRTFGTTLNGEVQKVLFRAKARKYPSNLAYELDRPNIPVSVYTRLIEGVNRNLPVFHRYLQLRKRLMKVDQLHYYDLYAPLVASVNLHYTPEEAERLVVDAVAPLGSEYQSVVRRAFDNRWIDLFPTPGKRSGAYSDGVYGVHPYMLLNYNGEYADVSTIAHEMGHTMQSYLSNQAQPYPLAAYPTFVAEVASTFNESLLIDYMLAHITDDDTRLALLGNYLENIKSTVFRQTQFAEFELRMHEMAEHGQAITGASLNELYLDITKKYYGSDQGICIVDPYVAYEWSYVPHFYRDFYVFQYATSFTASLALAEKLKAGDEGARERYLAFLSAGGSRYPIDLLKDAGVDMTTDEPLELTMDAMTRVMDEMEAILVTR